MGCIDAHQRHTTFIQILDCQKWHFAAQQQVQSKYRLTTNCQHVDQLETNKENLKRIPATKKKREKNENEKKNPRILWKI